MQGQFILLFIATSLLSGCTPEPPAIHPLKQLTHLDAQTKNDSDRENISIRKEYFVISNSPKDKNKIISLVKNYNAKTLDKVEIAKQYASFRIFYKETNNTPRDYKEQNRDNFDQDDFGLHSDDAVLLVKWTEFGKKEEYVFQDQ